MKNVKEVYHDINHLSPAEVKNFLKPHRTETTFYCVEGFWLSLPLYLLGTCIRFDDPALELAKDLLPAAPQTVTYA